MGQVGSTMNSYYDVMLLRLSGLESMALDAGYLR